MTTSQDDVVDVDKVAAEATQDIDNNASTSADDSSKDVDESQDSDADLDNVDDNSSNDNDSDDDLSPQDQKAIDSFSKLTEKEKGAKITNMLNSNRTEQVQQAELLKETFGIDVQPPRSQTVDKEAMKAALKDMGLDPAKLEAFQKSEEDKEKVALVDEWANTLGFDTQKALKNKDFVKTFHRTKGSMNEQVTAAVKAYAKTQRKASSEKITKSPSSTGGGSSTSNNNKSDYVDIDSMLAGKTLDQVDLNSL